MSNGATATADINVDTKKDVKDEQSAQKNDWNSMSGIVKIAINESNKGYNFFGFLKGLAGAIIIDPVKKKMEQFKEYLNTISANHDDQIEVPVNTKTITGDDFSTLYNGSVNTVTYKDARGADIACIAPTCNYNTEMYSIRSANEWATLDNAGVSDMFRASYEVALLTKKYADLYSEEWENNEPVFNSFKDGYRLTEEYVSAYTDFSKNPETVSNYDSVDAMKADFDKRFFEEKAKDPAFNESYKTYFDSYNDKLADEYAAKLSQYKDFCDKNNVSWESVLQNVSEEMQVEVYEYDKAGKYIFSQAGDNKNISQRGYLMLESVMKASDMEVRHPACIQYEYGVGHLSAVSKQDDLFTRFCVRACDKLSGVKEHMDNSVLLHPIKNGVVHGLEGLDAMFGRGSLAEKNDTVDEPCIDDSDNKDKDDDLGVDI